MLRPANEPRCTKTHPWSTQVFMKRSTETSLQARQWPKYKLTFLKMDVEKNLSVKYVPAAAADDCTGTQTQNGNSTCTRFFWFLVNSVIIIDKMILFSLLVDILFRKQCYSWSKAMHWHLECSTGSAEALHMAHARHPVSMKAHNQVLVLFHFTTSSQQSQSVYSNN